MKYFNFLLITILIVSMSFNMSRAEDESVAAIFLNEGMGARATAMGDAFVPIIDDVNSVFWNPGGLSFNKSIELLITHTEFIQGVRNEYLAFSMPISAKQVIGFNAYFSYLNDIEKIVDLTSEPTTYGIYDIYFTGAWSYRIDINQSAGIGLKGIYQQIDNYTAWSGAIDLGYVNKNMFIKNLVLAGTIKNLGLPIKFIETAYQLPLGLEIGAAYTMLDETLLVSFDVQKLLQQEFLFKVGAEYILEDIIFLRAGYKYAQFGNDLGPLSGLSVGLGAEISDYKIDYSYVPYAELGDIHKISITFPFGKSAADEEKIMKTLEKKLKAKQNKVVTNYIHNGNRFFKMKNYKSAIAQYEKALVLNPSLSKIRLIKRKANKLLRAGIINKHLAAGKRAYKKAEYVTALIEFNKAKDVDSSSKIVKKWIKKINKELNKPQVVIKGDKRVKRLFGQGLDHLGNGRYQDSIYTWKRILKIEPNNKQVIEYLDKTRAKLKQEIASLIRQGDKLWTSGEKPEAVKKWRKILKMSSRNEQALSRLRQHKIEIKNLAEEFYRNGVQNYVTNHLVEAIANWTYVLMLDPKNEKAQKNLRRAKLKLSEIESLEVDN